MDDDDDDYDDDDDDDDDNDNEKVTSTPNIICQKQNISSYSPASKNFNPREGGGVAAPGGEEGLCVCLPVLLACGWPPALPMGHRAR